ncbi:MAG: uracil-DNA glycosylase family protein, partial [Pseudomonadota bacterium]
MAQETTYQGLVAALDWQLELGADEAILDTPVDRFGLDEPGPRLAEWFTAPKPAELLAKPAPQAPALAKDQASSEDAIAEARQLSAAADSLDALRSALEGYQHCDLRKGARSLVFADGRPGARVMVVGEAPGAEEDRQGKPFVGRAGQLLDK